MKVRDVMTYGVISVPESASIAEAIETMLRSRVSAVVVFDADHALSGILSEGDLLRRSELGSEPERPYWLELLIGSGRLADAYAHEHGRKAGEVMTREVETITEDAELSEAVDRMIHRRIKRLPVLRGETLVGIVSRSDLLKGLLAATPSTNAEHSDTEIKAAILAELDKLEWAPRASVSVEVQNGAVTFDGSIINYLNEETITVNSGTGADMLTQAAQPAAALVFDPSGNGATLNVNVGTFTFDDSTGGIPTGGESVKRSYA